LPTSFHSFQVIGEYQAAWECKYAMPVHFLGQRSCHIPKFVNKFHSNYANWTSTAIVLE